jgi:tetratricopeptide (TPR) repeat protein
MGVMPGDDGGSLPPPPRSARGEPSKTLFGMQGLNFDTSFDDDGGLAFPTDDDDGVGDEAGDGAHDDDGGLAFPTDDDSGVSFERDAVTSFTADDGLAFPTDDDDDVFAPVAPPVAAPAVSKSPPRAVPARAAAPPPPGWKGAAPPPPPVRPPGASKPVPPPRRTGSPTKLAMRPPPIGGGSGGGAKPPPTPGPKPPIPSAKPPPPRAAPPPLPPPPPPIDDPFASGILPIDSGVMAAESGVMPAESGVMTGGSGTFDDDDDDPFFAGDLERLPELGSITHGDANEFAEEDPAARSGVQEFEFQGDSETIELADLSPASSASPKPSVEFTSQRPNFDSPDFAGLDLPAASSGVQDIVDDGFDLPMPAGAVRDLDLPEPPGFGGSTGGGFRPEIELAAPRGAAPELDLPTDGLSSLSPISPIEDIGFADGLSLDDLPMPSPDLPMPVDNLPGELDDFHSPVDDFPAPDFDNFDSLPTAADSLPRAVDSLPRAVDSLPVSTGRSEPKANLVPASVDDLDLDLDEGQPEPGGLRGLGEKPIATPIAATTGVPAGAHKQKTARLGRGPRRAVNRYVIYGVLGAVVLIGGGVVAMQMGLFDSGTDDPPIEQGDSGEQVTPPTSEPTERPEGVLAKFDQDTPASYVQAYELSEDDPVGRAEAALLLHYRYGPDPARLAEARELLAPYQTRPEPFVRRVVGLALLVAGKRDEALAMLDDPEPRSSLYQAWVLLDKGETERARAAAQAAVAARPNDQAAQLTVLQVRFAANPVDGIAAMRQAAKTSPNHLALQEALMHAALDQGRLDEAAQIGQAIQPSSISDTHKGEILRQRAGIAMAQGRTGAAMRLLDQALASDEGLTAARIDRIDLWLSNKDFSSVRAELDVLMRGAAENDPLLVKTAARVDLEAGLDDEARARLEALGEAGSQDPEVQDLFGQAHALVMKTDEARSAFALARKLDPLYTAPIVHEVDLLIRADLREDALKLLDEQLAALIAADAKASVRGRQGLATVGRVRAEVLLSKGELERALTAIEDAITSDPASNDALLLRARLLDQLDQRQAHEEALLELHERTGGYPGLTEPLGKVLLRKGKLDELEALISASLDAPEASREIILTGAALRLAQDRPDQAQSLAQKVLERDPTDTRAHLLLGRALLVQGQYARALSEIESAQTREGHAEVEMWLGQALEYNARPNDARGHYTRALALDPKNLEAAALLGRLYAYEGAAAKAIELLEPVVQQTDAYPYAYLALGLAHKDMGKRDLAITDFQKAQQLDATLFEAFYQEGRIHNDLNKHGPAVKALQAAIDNAKANATERALVDAYRRLGESYFELNRRAEAKAALNEYLNLAPANAAGRSEVERLLRGL